MCLTRRASEVRMQVDSDPAERLRSALANLHREAGSPSSREMASGIEKASHTTIAQALSGRRVPSWPVLQAVVEYLGGDQELFRGLWGAATAKGTPSARLGRAEQEFLTRYRRSVAMYHGRLAPPDFGRRRLVPLAEIYVEQAILPPDSGTDGSMYSLMALRQFDELITRTVLLGDPGIGKSTACGVLMYRHANDGGLPVPFLVTARNFAGMGAPERSVIAFLERELETLYQCPAPPGLIERLLLDGQALVMFDGLDELIEPALRAEVASIIEIFCAEFPASRVLVTSRLVGYSQAELDPDQFTVYRITGFRQEQVAEYVNKWFALEEYGASADAGAWARGFLEESSIASDLRTNPLMLALLCILYRGSGSLPRRRAEIYEACANLLFSKWDERRQIRAVHSMSNLVYPVLRGIAWWMFTRGLASPVTERELVTEVTRILHERAYEHEPEAAEAAAEFIKFINGRMWVLTDVGTTSGGERIYAFTHRTFLEYFAASYLAYVSDSPEHLAANLIPLFGSRESETVAELAIYIKDRTSTDGINRVFDAVMSKKRRPSEYATVLYFWLRFMVFADITPRAVRALVRHVLEYVREDPSTEDATEMLGLLLVEDDWARTVVADELTVRLAELIESDAEGERSAGVRLAGMICRIQRGRYRFSAQTIRRGDADPDMEFWRRWCEEIDHRCSEVASDAGGTGPVDIRPSAFSWEIMRNVDTETGKALLLSVAGDEAARILNRYPPHIAGELLRVVADSRPDAVAAILRNLPGVRAGLFLDYLSPAAGASILTLTPSDEVVRILDNADIRTISVIIMELPIEAAARLVREMPDERVADVLSRVTPAAAAAIIQSLPEKRDMILRRFSPSFRMLVMRRASG